MKKLTFYLVVFVLVVTMIYFIVKNEKIESAQLLSVNTFHSYIYSSDKDMEFNLYTNDNNHTILKEEAIESSYLTNHLDTKKVSISLNKIYEGHQEVYLGTIYTKYTYSYSIPYLGSDFYIDECYLLLRLSDFSEYKIFIGKVTIFSEIKSSGTLDFNSLEAIKNESSSLSRIYEIHIKLSLNISINSVLIGYDYDLTFSIENDILKVRIPSDNELLYYVPIIINYGSNELLVIEQFKFIIDYDILIESGPLINVYSIN